LQPDDLTFLDWLVGKLPGEEALAFLSLHLHDTPVLVDWHRAYQDLVRKLHPNEDLLPAYRKLVTETKEAPAALYLLARIQDQDLDEADKLLRRAAAAKPPCVYAMHALGYHALEQGRFDDALSWTEKAVKLAPYNPIVQGGYRQALLASHQYDRLLDELREQGHLAGQQLPALVEQIRVYAAKGDQAKARAILEETMRSLRGPQFGPDRAQVQAHLEMLIDYGARDVAGFLKLAPQLPDVPPFQLALLRGNLAEAAGRIKDKADDAGTQHALLYLAALKAGDQKLADQQEQALVTALGKGRPPWRQMGRILSGRQKLDSNQVRRLPIEPEQKRVLVAVLARRYPDSAQNLLPLARKLDFAADLTSLCLRKVLA
jgi:tetratricopeptide (TPR) repeat protein